MYVGLDLKTNKFFIIKLAEDLLTAKLFNARKSLIMLYIPVLS
jgi:hypothetical protein